MELLSKVGEKRGLMKESAKNKIKLVKALDWRERRFDSGIEGLVEVEQK